LTSYLSSGLTLSLAECKKRRQETGGSKSEAKRASTVSVLTFFNWIVISIAKGRGQKGKA
jgi:hypothetical protein